MSAEPHDAQRLYEEACIIHADAQGLTPVSDILTKAGIPHNLEQTGGFCMVINVPYPTADRYLWLTSEAHDEVLIGLYDVDTDQPVNNEYITTHFDNLVSTINQLKGTP